MARKSTKRARKRNEDRMRDMRPDRELDWKVIGLKRFVFARDGYRCKYCKRTGVELTIDHVVPKCRGGRNHPRNTVAACTECNCAKGDMTVRTFLELAPWRERK